MWCSGVRRRRRLSRQAWPNLWKLFSDNSSLTLRQIRPAEPHRATGRPEFRRGLRSRYSQLPHLHNFANPAGSQCIHASKPEAVSNGFASDLGDPASEGYVTSIIHYCCLRTDPRAASSRFWSSSLSSFEAATRRASLGSSSSSLPHRPLFVSLVLTSSSNVLTGQKHTTMEKLSRSLTGYPSRAPART